MDLYVAFMAGLAVGVVIGFSYAAYLVYAISNPIDVIAPPPPGPGPIGVNWSGVEVFIGREIGAAERRP